MIEINLLPEELRARKIKSGFDRKYLLLIIPLAAVILIVVHIYLTAMLVAKNYQAGVYAKKWKSLESDRNRLEKLKKESTVALQDVKAIQDIVAKRINWSEKLNKLSLSLPSGVWFNEVSVGEKDLVLKSSVISLQKGELNLINTFIEKLKSDRGFFDDFEGLELGNVQRRVLGGYEVVDFTLTGKIKQK